MPNSTAVHKHHLRKLFRCFPLYPLKQPNQMVHLSKRQVKRDILLRHFHNIIRLIRDPQLGEIQDSQYGTCLPCIFDKGNVYACDVFEPGERWNGGEC